jgi:hypothetical protein
MGGLGARRLQKAAVVEMIKDVQTNVLEGFFPQGVFVTNSASKAQTKVELGLQAGAVHQLH